MSKTYILKATRISAEMVKNLNEASKELDFRKSDLVRFLLNRGLQQLKSDSIKANGYKNLQITLRQQ